MAKDSHRGPQVGDAFTSTQTECHDICRVTDRPGAGGENQPNEDRRRSARDGCAQGPVVGGRFAQFEGSDGQPSGPGSLGVVEWPRSEVSLDHFAAELDLSDAALQDALAEDLDRLRNASGDLDATREWVEQYADEAAALAALTRGVAKADAKTEARVENKLAELPERGERARSEAPSNAQQDQAGRPASARPVPLGANRTKTSGGERAYHVEGRDSPQGVEATRPQQRTANDRNESGQPLKDQRNIQPEPESTIGGSVEVGLGEQEPDALQDSSRQHDQEESLVVKLGHELRRVRAELEAAKAKAERQTRMYGSVGEQTRKLDRRASELRQRVAQAQQVLDERARKLRESFAKERDRLGAYREKLQRQAKEISESTGAMKARLQKDFEKRREELEAEFEQRRASLESVQILVAEKDEVALEQRKVDLDQEVRARIEKIEHDAAVKMTDLDLRERTLSKRAIELDRRSEELDKALAEREIGLETKASEARIRAREEHDRAERDLAEKRRAFEKERAEHIAGLDRQAEAIKEREATLESRSAESERRKTHAEEQEQENKRLRDQLATRESDLDRRDEDLARMSAAMEVRERRLAEWQGRLDKADARREELEHELDAKQTELTQLDEQLGERKSAVEDESTRLEIRQDELQQKASLLDSRHAELEERTAVLGEQEKEVAYQARELEERDAALQEEREEYRLLQAKAEEIEQQSRELDATATKVFRREAALKERAAAYKQDLEELREARQEVKNVRADLESHRQLLEERETKIEDRVSQAVDLEQRANRAKESQEAELEQLEALQAAHDQSVVAAEKKQAELLEAQANFCDEQSSLELDRKRLDEDRESFVSEQQAFEGERERLRTEQEEIAKARRDIEDHLQDVKRKREEIAKTQTTIESERAKLEREGIELRDSQRAVGEEKSRLAATRQEAEETRRELAKQIEETEEIRRQLSLKAERMRSRQARLAEDTATVDARLQALDGELKAAREERIELDEEKVRIQEETRSIAAEREGLESERSELDQLRRTYQAGRREVDEGRADVAKREDKLSERANQLEAFRNRMEEEHADLQRQQQELVAAREHTGDSSDQLATLVKQAETRQEELRRRHETLDTHEQALAARSAELIKAEDALLESEEQLRAKANGLDEDEEALEAQRREFEAVMESERTEVDKLRRLLEEEITVERDKMRGRVAELEAALAARDHDDEVALLDQEKTVLEQSRLSLEAELSERIASVEKRENEIEQYCQDRLGDIESDIEQKLDTLETEIRARREQAEKEIEDRRASIEAELAQARARLDEQVGELRHRQTAVSEEQLQLRQERSDMEAERLRVGPQSYQAEAGSDEKVDDTTEADVVEDTDSIGEDVETQSHIVLDEDTCDETEEVIAEDEADANNLCESDLSDIASDESLAAAVKERRLRQVEPVGFNPVRAALIGVVLGLLAGAACFWLLPHDVEVQGRLTLGVEGLSDSMSAQEHIANLNEPAIINAASAKVGVDLGGLFYTDKVIQFAEADDGRAVVMTARVPESGRETARGWIDAIGDAYLASIGENLASKTALSERITALDAEIQAKTDALAVVGEALQDLESRMQSEVQSEQVRAIRARKESLRTEMETAEGSSEKAATALAEFDATPAMTGPITPSDAQLAQASAADAELMEAISDRAAKAQEFHSVLTKAMSEAQTPLSTLLARIELLASEVGKQLEGQTDTEIRRELEVIAGDVAEYQSRAEAFVASWDELGPKVAAWEHGDDPDVLIEYQKKAESLIRDFHSNRRAFGTAASGIDAIGRGGSEMTKRRIVESSLKGIAQDVFTSLSEWIVSAQGVLPHYNLEMKALRNAIHNLTQRIAERQRGHREKLVEHLAVVRANDRKAERSRLENEAAETARQLGRLKDLLLDVDAELMSKGVDVEQLDAFRVDILGKKDRQAELIREISGLRAEIKQSQSVFAAASSGDVVYEPSGAEATAVFGMGRTGTSFGAGLAVLALYTLAVWLFSPSRHSQLKRSF